MSGQFPENVYRPPYEWASVAAYTTAAVVINTMNTPSSIAYACTGAFIFLAGKRLLHALRIMRFRKNIRKLPYYALTADEMPVSDKALFLGKGFRWNQTHTQRLFMIRQPENAHLRESSWLYKKARLYEIHTKGHNFLTQITRSNAWWNPVAPLPPVGGSPELHGVETDESDIWEDLGERVGHKVVLGTTRVGKTRMAESMIIQDIARGDITIVFDPKGDADLLTRMYVEAEKHQRQFYMFHLGFPEYSCRYNPIGDYGRITEVATRIANQLPSEGQSAAFRDFVWRFVNVLTKTMEGLSIKPSYENIYKSAANVDELAGQYFKLVLDRDHPNWERAFEQFEMPESEAKSAVKTGRNLDTMKLGSFLKTKTHNEPLIDALGGILSNDRSYFEKLVSSLYPLLEKLTTGEVAKLISPDASNLNDLRPIMDWRKVMDSNAVVYVGLDSLSDPEVAGAVGNAMFADLTSLAGQIYKFGHSVGQSDQSHKRKVAIHADEFNELIGDEFIPLLNKAGGAGYQVTVYTQTWTDVEAKIGSTAKAGQIGGNLNTMIMLRVKTTETAEMLTNQLPDVKVMTSTLVSRASDVAFPESHEDFSSGNEDRIGSETVPMLSPSDLTQLPKGQAFALIEGGQLYKIRLPLPKKDPNEKIPKHITEIAQAMREKSGLSQPENTQQAFVDGKTYY